MKRPYGVFVNGLLMNRHVHKMGANRLVADYAEKGIIAVVREVCECGQIQNSLCQHAEAVK